MLRCSLEETVDMLIDSWPAGKGGDQGCRSGYSQLISPSVIDIATRTEVYTKPGTQQGNSRRKGTSRVDTFPRSIDPLYYPPMYNLYSGFVDLLLYYREFGSQ
mmetsp:Transcript_46642/g.54507  ORF Transcript_46642/g.54507 Transcript_46642/m.54507 type:complete len:103 (+) Transcript_46642:25-333(+)